jgi:hypothetical protein
VAAPRDDVTVTGTPGSVPAIALPVTVAGDLVLIRTPELAIWAGAVSAWWDGFEFTLRMLHDRRSHAPVPDFDILPRDQGGAGSWLSIRFADSPARAADLNSHTSSDQPSGPEIRLIWGEGTSYEAHRRWRVTPLPPPGPVELTVHLSGPAQQTASGIFDGAAILAASRRSGPGS